MPHRCLVCDKTVMRRKKGDELIPVLGTYVCKECRDAEKELECPHCGSTEKVWKDSCAECDPICEECGDYLHDDTKKRGDMCAECEAALAELGAR